MTVTVKSRALGSVAIAGALLYAAAGGVMAAGNLGWFGWSRNANRLFVWMGLGLAMVVFAFAVVHGRDIWTRHAAGPVAAVFGILAPVVLLMSLVVEFAILGTFATFFAIVAFAVTVHRGKLVPIPDAVLLYAAAVASITWNTETASAGLLVIVGLILAWVSYRALIADSWRRAAASPGQVEGGGQQRVSS